MNVQVIIPVYHAGDGLNELLRRLSLQTVLPAGIRLVVTMDSDGSEYDRIRQMAAASAMTVRVSAVPKDLFDHGGTRRKAAWEAMSDHADFLVLMTQDAMPADERLLEKLIEPCISDPRIGASYARQLPAPDAGMTERFYREFNYPDVSCVRGEEDLGLYGIKTYFCSNVCAVYRSDAYQTAGGFPERAIFNEDMVLCARMLKKGYRVSYTSDACVLHSHNYTILQQFHRSFDLGVSQTDFPDVFDGVASEGEGLSMVKKTSGKLIAAGRPWLVVRLFWQSAARYAGFRLGKGYNHLPKGVVRFCTMNPNYWKEHMGD